ncbi:DNA mismatch repair endonuclease MutL [Paraglaciecola hydrolytica]|uniref:DNA mismatch repair protein MutL n=1 Tax=Paraglaciecola hydrolytica TaxID=1799789 RepID=A0A136A5A6_9ALTE|nr:DNA mismatch repair endonuclease MutL [Paraglaciecola hydrolytica]KXI30310.1 DNA mismatch repair protein MutL [Paraglaciecola hydrolytica]
MPIQILPAILANQIAAGEVVERPASVVKELVENSLDSGASLIEIEIEKGGHKQILVRDNGNGIPQQELALALSRHATSKISSLDDLEHIVSLGFRGEALASISSVSRLSLSSKPAEQNEAWQAHSEGRDMQVQLTPIAHPKGTSVDVTDLFFNTPARRKFLKAEKTEFSHIDEIIRRIALSRFDVAFSLKHNGKLLRKYPAADNSVSKHKRLISICGKEFGEQAIELNSQYQDFSLQGWLAPPNTAKPQVDCQYFYVNGRMMRDKLLNHAVRQALEGVIAPEHQLAYVLYFSLDTAQVDVNVHPAKHEVRFHQSRLVHDFVYRALSDAINQYFSASPQAGNECNELAPVEPNHSYIQPLRQAQPNEVNERHRQHSEFKSAHASASQSVAVNYAAQPTSRQSHLGNSAQAAQHYQQLMSAPEPNGTLAGSWLKIDDKQLLVSTKAVFYLVPIKALLKAQLQRNYAHAMPVSQPLLLPISIEGDVSLLAQAKALSEVLLQNSIDITWQHKRIILRKIPAGMRQYNWSVILEKVLQTPEHSAQSVKQYLLDCLAEQQSELAEPQISLLWTDFCQPALLSLDQQLAAIGRKVPLQEWIAKHD